MLGRPNQVWANFTFTVLKPTDILDGMASRWIVGAPVSVIFPCTMKSRRWRATVEVVEAVVAPTLYVVVGLVVAASLLVLQCLGRISDLS